MLPRKLHSRPRTVRKFELIMPDGQIYEFPPPSPLQRLTWSACAHAEIAAVSAAILVLIYIAGFAADAIDRSALDACNERIMRPTGVS
ncbi:hypothetical protein AS156_10695 [Bradyrhizobium macuxiense]|uniref:Uncharacterized protein n=2 Tax=Bradyrhizobium macuxiense TaxID=1755647 RepID=A0A109JNI2_9BRAD|nr:hypothetical protein AS156_10695 [Bradyrhizobium macuxiense]